MLSLTVGTPQCAGKNGNTDNASCSPSPCVDYAIISLLQVQYASSVWRTRGSKRSNSRFTMP